MSWINDIFNMSRTLNQMLDMLAEHITKEDIFMSQVTDWAAKEQADLTAISATLDSIVTGIAALDAMITQLQTTGTLSAADQAALDAIQTASAALVTKSAAISTAPPATPAPPVTPPTA